MRSSILIPVLLGAGALGHPHFKLNNPLGHVHHKRQAPVDVQTIVQGNVVDIEDIFVKTIYANGASAPSATPAQPNKAAVVPASPPVSTTAASAPVQVNADYHAASPPETNQPAPAATSAPAPAPATSDDSAPLSNGKSILQSANEFRAKQALSPFTYSSTLNGNAAKTNTDDGANNMVHELNPGSYAQCIGEVDNTSGGSGFTSFELTYLGWLCEIPDTRLGDDCSIMESLTNMGVNTTDPGHANILRSSSYSQMGCNYQDSTDPHDNFKGMYTCDFA